MSNGKLKLIVLILILLISPFLLTLCPRQAKKKPPKTQQFPNRIDADFPTDLVFTQDKLFITEKGGALKVLDKGKEEADTLTTVKVPDLAGYNETGLLGIALSPNFEKDKQIYLYHTYQKDSQLFNRVIRIQEDEPNAKPVIILNILNGIRGERIHNGGKLAFGPDGNLYIATGEADEPALAQNKNSLNGKVLRVKPDGSIPEDNPFNNAVWSFGHRNIFGMTFDNKGNLFITENGPEGNDEVNKIKRGANYGWPEVSILSKDVEQPLIIYEKSIAPTGIIFYTGNRFDSLKDKLVFSDFLDGNVHRLTLADNKAEDKIVARSQGQINALAQTKEGLIYIAIRNQIKKLEF